MTTARTHVPEGYIEDAKGRLVPETLVKPLDKLRHETALEMMALIRDTHDHLKTVKRRLFNLMEAYVDIAMEQYDADPKSGKGHVAIATYDGRVKIERSPYKGFVLTEELKAARGLIDEYLSEQTATISPELRAIVEDIFEVGETGRPNVKQIMRLLRYNIDDPRWRRAMKAIQDALKVVYSNEYIRGYERNEDTGKYENVTLQFSAVPFDAPPAGKEAAE